MTDPTLGFILPFLRALDDLYIESDHGPRPGSPAALEAGAYARAESVQTAYGQAAMALQSARDQLEAIDLIVRVGQPSVAHYTNFRGLLEASSVASWLFDTGISVQDRVSRSLALRFHTLKMQRKLAAASGDAEAVAALEKRIEDAERLASSLGFAPIRNKKGERDGIGQRKPNISELIESQFALRSVFPVLSGAAHSEFASIMSLGFTVADSRTTNDQPFVQRKVNIEMLNLVISTALTVYVRPLWMQVIQWGLDRSRAAKTLEDVYNQAGLSPTDSLRHWRRELG